MMLMASAMAACSLLADAQLYEMDITVKTTKSVSGNMKDVSCDCKAYDESNGLYRKPKNTIKIKGVIWGCDCGTLIKGIPFTATTNPFGYFFWNVTSGKPLNVKLDWELCNRIDVTSTKAEAVWVLYSEDDSFYLTGAGFGTIKDTTKREPVCMLVTSRFPSLSGNFAGWMNPGAIVTTKATSGTCTWCEKVAGTAEVTATAKGLTICSDCSPNKTHTGTAAFGTWKIKYNANVSKKMSAANAGVAELRITDFYKFPSYVVEAMNKGDQEYATAKAAAQAKLDAAKQVATEATAKAEAAKTAADDAAKAAETAEADAKAARDAANAETDTDKKTELEATAAAKESAAADAKTKAEASQITAGAAEDAKKAADAAVEQAKQDAELFGIDTK